jgi:hypothetical protein
VPTAEELLRAAAMGRISVDRRLVQSILDSGDAPDAAAAVLRFARANHDNERIDLDPLLVDLLRHLKAPESLDYLVEIIRRDPRDIPDELVEAVLPFGERAVAPLIDLYEEVGEEDGEDIAFLIAGLRIHDERALALLLDRLEFDAADGAFCLGLYGDPAAKPALDKMLGEVPEEEVELRREIKHAIEQLDAPQTKYEPEPFDILAEYPERALPAFDLLPEEERIEMLSNEDPLVRAGAAYSFFNATLNAKSKAALLERAKTDDDVKARARAWEALADVTEDRAVADQMIAIMKDPQRDIDERGGAAVGLYAIGEREDVRIGIEALYEMGGAARAKGLEAMWRSLYLGYAKYFAPHLDDNDPKIVKEALRGAGYFRLTKVADKIAKFFDADPPFDHLRDDALFAYAMAMPGETTRGRVRGMLRKIDSITPLSAYERELVEFGLDERLRLHGMDPVFSAESHSHEYEEEAAAPEPAAASSGKVGRNDPCPCGSGKKYKKCHGG